MIPIGATIRATVADARSNDVQIGDGHVDQFRDRDHSNGIAFHGLIV